MLSFSLVAEVLTGLIYHRPSGENPLLFVSHSPGHLKGQLQRFDKLSLFDRFRHVENGLDINF